MNPFQSQVTSIRTSLDFLLFIYLIVNDLIFQVFNIDYLGMLHGLSQRWRLIDLYVLGVIYAIVQRLKVFC